MPDVMKRGSVVAAAPIMKSRRVAMRSSLLRPRFNGAVVILAR
jgi:hypothetical protein